MDWDTHRLVKLVKKLESTIEAEDNKDIPWVGMDVNAIAMAQVKQHYYNEYKKSTVTQRRLDRLIKHAIKQGFLDVISSVKYGLEMDFVYVLPDGKEFTDTFCWFIPIGLYAALWEKHGKLTTGLFAGF